MDDDVNNINIVDTNNTDEQMLIILTICQKLLLKPANKSDIELCQEVLRGRPTHGPTDVFASIIEDIPTASKYVLACLYFLTMSVSLFGNSLVILSFVCNRHMRSTMNVFIVSLAVSDFFVTVTCMPINIGTALSRFWILGEFVCKSMPFLINLTVASSSLTLCCIAFDRYYAVVHPLKQKFTKTPKFAAAFLAGVWILSISSSIPYAYMYNLSRLCDDANTCNGAAYICVASNDGTVESLKIWMTFVVLLIIPFILIGVTYAIIVLELWVKTPVGRRLQNAAYQRTRFKRKAIKMLVLVVLLYACCWSPLLVFDVISKEKNLQASELNLDIRYYLQWLALSGACYNPIIYAFMNERFRKNFVILLLCRRPRVHVQQDERRSERVNIVVQNISEEPVTRSVQELPTASDTVTHV